MIWAKKRPDPISERTKALTREISSLEAEIRRLDQQLQQPRTQPRLRSTALPGGAPQPAPEPAPAPLTPSPPPTFEPDSLEQLRAPDTVRTTPEHFNRFGARRYDLPALLRRCRAFFRRPSPAHPELVKYLRTGSVKGLPTLRKETRVARNRFIALAIVFFLLLLGILSVFVRNH